MSHLRSWAKSVTCLVGIAAAGCQSSGSPDTKAMVPAFGINGVPKQTEPDLDYDDSERAVASADSDSDQAESDGEAGGRRKGTLLSRLLPGKEKEPLERRPLPVNQSTEGESDDDQWE